MWVWSMCNSVRGQTDLVAESMPRHDIFMAGRPSHPLAGRAGLRLADILAFPMASTLIVNEVVTAAVASGGTSDLLDAGHGELIPAIHVNSYALARQIACDTDASGSRYRADAGAGTERWTVGVP